MAIIADCHLHSSFSGDSEASMEDMIKAGIDKGLKFMCFTEHQDFEYIHIDGYPDDYFEVNTDQYLYHLLSLRDKYKSQIRVNFGIELGMQDHLSRKNAIYAKSHDFDFIIASSHLCNGKDPYYKEFFEGRDETEAYHEYFKYISECISSCMSFDVYGHLDYILRYGPNKNAHFTYGEYAEDIDKILNRLIDNGKGIEVNSSGFAYGMHGPHPSMEILLRYKELGGELITIGSDAHKPEDVARGFKETEELLLECGYKFYSVFDGRMPEMFRLG